jgi:hypothetical protein
MDSQLLLLDHEKRNNFRLQDWSVHFILFDLFSPFEEEMKMERGR